MNTGFSAQINELDAQLARTLLRKSRLSARPRLGTEDFRTHLRLCVIGFLLGALGASAIAIWFRFGEPLARPIELALAAISVGCLILAGVAVLNAIGPLLTWVGRTYTERLLLEEDLAETEETGLVWQALAVTAISRDSRLANTETLRELVRVFREALDAGSCSVVHPELAKLMMRQLDDVSPDLVQLLKAILKRESYREAKG